MISCTEFIPAYSELFKFINELGGKEKVIDFWKYLSKEYVEKTLGKSVKEKGIRGCYDYWSHSLNEEAADFEMMVDDEKEEFKINMKKCPSRSLLNETVHIEAYEDYCEHCDWLYRLVLEPLGYTYDIALDECKDAKCSIYVTRKKKES